MDIRQRLKAAYRAVDIATREASLIGTDLYEQLADIREQLMVVIKKEQERVDQ